jgi:hypothetical protein
MPCCFMPRTLTRTRSNGTINSLNFTRRDLRQPHENRSSKDTCGEGKIRPLLLTSSSSEPLDVAWSRVLPFGIVSICLEGVLSRSYPISATSSSVQPGVLIKISPLLIMPSVGAFFCSCDSTSASKVFSSALDIATELLWRLASVSVLFALPTWQNCISARLRLIASSILAWQTRKRRRYSLRLASCRNLRLALIARTFVAEGVVLNIGLDMMLALPKLQMTRRHLGGK